MNKRRVFIGSSKEGIDLARALFSSIEDFAEPTIWDQDIFNLSEYSLVSLINHLKDIEFTILLLTPDDIGISRDKINEIPRDNLIFELGLSIGILGLDKTFFVVPKDNENFKMPSDFKGITYGFYTQRVDGNLIASFTTFASQLKKNISKTPYKIKLPAEFDMIDETEHIIEHYLGYRPTVEVYDIDGNKVGTNVNVTKEKVIVNTKLKFTGTIVIN